MRITRTAESPATCLPRAATMRISALATAFLMGTTAISLLAAPAAGAATLPSAAASSTNQTVSTTWGHDDKNGRSKRKPTTTHTHTHPAPAPAPTTGTSTGTKTVAWLMPKSTEAWATWPQELADSVPECGTGWYQVDVYRYGTTAEKLLVDTITSDGALTGPSEDRNAYLSHTFTQPVNDAATCAPTTEVPASPVSGGLRPVETPFDVAPVNDSPAIESPVVASPDLAAPVAEIPVEIPVEIPDAAAPVVESPQAVTPDAGAAPVATAPTAPTAASPRTPVSGAASAFGTARTPSAVPPATVGSTDTLPVTVTAAETLAVTGARVGIVSALAVLLVAAGVVAFHLSRRAKATMS